jgi:hypothetical protein
MHSPADIWSAISRGSEFVPPTYNILLHEYSRLAGLSYLALRLPSIAAVCFTGLCSMLLFRRYIGSAPAIFACCLILEALRFTALQIRPYGAGIACFALALLFWDDLNWARSRWRPLLIFLCLTFAICLHFYDVLFVPCLALIEFLRSTLTRKFRWPVWLALLFAGLSIFAWRPLMRALSQYNAGDTTSPHFYARPSLTRLANTYYGLFCESRKIPILILAAVALIAIFCLLRVKPDHEEPSHVNQNFWVMSLGVSLFPLIVFIFSLVVTQTYNDRYVVGTIIGISALLAGALGSSPWFRRGVPLLACLAGLLTLSHQIAVYGAFDRPPVFNAIVKDIPIVIADAQQFFTLEESSPERIRSRLVYLTLPRGVEFPDPTVVNQLLRWKAINPQLPVMDAETFLKSHKEFYLLDTHAGTDDTPLNYILKKNVVDLKFQFSDGSLLLESRDR